MCKVKCLHLVVHVGSGGRHIVSLTLNKMPVVQCVGHDDDFPF